MGSHGIGASDRQYLWRGVESALDGVLQRGCRRGPTCLLTPASRPPLGSEDTETLVEPGAHILPAPARSRRLRVARAPQCFLFGCSPPPSGAGAMPGGLHCCGAPVARLPALLACEATAKDAIEAVPFAAFGAPSEVCGQEAAGACAEDAEHAHLGGSLSGEALRGRLWEILSGRSICRVPRGSAGAALDLGQLAKPHSRMRQGSSERRAPTSDRHSERPPLRTRGRPELPGVAGGCSVAAWRQPESCGARSQCGACFRLAASDKATCAFPEFQR